MEKQLNNNILFRGIGALTFGLVALCYPGDGITALIVPFGALVSISGLITLFHYASRATFWQRMMFRKGLGELLIGIVTLLGAAFSAPLFMAMLAIWAMVTGGALVARFHRIAHRFAEAPVMIATGWLTLAFGLYLAASLTLPIVSLTYEIAVFALLLGSSLLYGYTKLKGLRKYLGNRPGKIHSTKTATAW